jgi:hypothetical protein
MNQRILLSLSIFIFFLISTQAQETPRLLFKLSDQQVEQLITKSRYGIYLPGDEVRKKRRAIMLGDPIDTLAYDQNPIFEGQAPGSYFLTTVQGDRILGELYVHSEISAFQVIPSGNQNLVYLSTKGQKTGTETVFYQGKKIPFDQDAGAFVMPRSYKRGLLKVQTQRETRFFTYQRGKPEKVKKYYIYNANGDFLAESSKGGKRDYYGYLLVSQPRYRPGDTLRIKALIFDKKGNPQTESFELYCSAVGKPMATVSPKRPGLYLLDVPLKDSLGWKLDVRYSLRLRETSGRRHYLLDYVYFKYEDYELDESKFTLRTDKSLYHPGDSVQIFAQMEDANGVPLPGGEVMIEVNFARLGVELPEELYLPLTLLKDTFSLNTGTNPIAVIPKDKVLNTSVTYVIKADFRATNNELETQYHQFVIQPKHVPEKLSSTWKNDTLLLDYQSDSIKTGVIRITDGRHSNTQKRPLIDKKINFPFFLKLSPNMEMIVVTVAGKKEYIYAPQPPISVEKSRKGDSVFFKIINPWNWPISYDLQKKNQILIEGNSTADWQWEGISPDAEPLILRYHYFQHDQAVSREAVLMVAEGRLNLEVNQPDRIEPGDSVDIQITVTDDFGRPMPNVDLTAWAINNRFPEDNAPNIYGRAHPQRVKFERERGWLYQPENNSYRKLQQHHIEAFGLGELDTYRMRYPDSISYRHIPLEDKKRREFAPFIFQEGLQFPIQLLYVNDQLVYFEGASNMSPFSFQVFTDTATLRIRLGEYEYKLKDIVFKKGYKTEISFNHKNLPSSIQRIEKGDTLTRSELKQLNNSVIWLQKAWPDNTEVALWQLGNTILLPQNPDRYYDGKQRYCIGPLLAPDLALAVRGEYGRYLEVNSGYSYSPGRNQMLVEEVMPFKKTFLTESWRSYPQQMGRVSIPPKDIILTARERVNTARVVRKTIDGEQGKIMIPFRHRTGVQVFVRTCDDPFNIWTLGMEEIYDLAEGCYNIIYRDGQGRTAVKDSVFIRKKELLVLKRDEIWTSFTFDTLMNRVLSSDAQIVHQEGGNYAMNRFLANGSSTIRAKVKTAAGAEVLFFRNQLALHKRTDEKGEFEVHNIASGVYDVLVIYPGHRLYWKIMHVKEGMNFWEIPLVKYENDSLDAHLQQALKENQYFQLFNQTQTINGKEMDSPFQFDLIFKRNDLKLLPENDFFRPYTYPARKWTIRWTKGSYLPKTSSSKENGYNYERPQILDPYFLSTLRTNSRSDCNTCAMGQVRDAVTGEPLLGAIVVIEGTRIGTFTDEKGYFYLESPQASGLLKVNFIGYASKTVRYSIGVWSQVRLSADYLQIDEVVVTSLQGQTSGVMVGGSGRPLFQKRNQGGNWMVNPLSEKVQSREESKYLSRNALVNKNGRAMDEDKDGLEDRIDIEPGGIPAAFGDSLGGLEPPSPIDFASLRSDFRDNAYWRPDLLTDANGQARIRVKMPDDITGWKTHVYAMNSKLQVGRKDGMIQSLKQLTARLSLPRFMVEGDSAMLIGRVINYGTESDIQTAFGLTEDDIDRHDTTVKELLIEQYPIVADVKPPLFGGEPGAPFDTLSPRYLLIRKNGELDGELREIPIFPQGVLENEGSFFYLEGDTSVSFLPQAGEGTVELMARANPLQVLLQDLNYLIRYPHDCNEQMASRLTAMRLTRDVHTALDLPDDNLHDINKLKRRLHRSQNPDGSWGWWPGNGGSLWMTAYVARSLYENDPQDPRLKKAFAYLRDSMRVKYSRYGRYQTLSLLINMGEMGAVTDYEFFFDRLAIDTIPRSPYEKLMVLRLQQLTGRDVSMDSLLQGRKRTVLGSMYWGQKGWRWSGGEVEQTLLAYKILRDAGDQEASLRRIRAYFFETRQRYGWRNTIETAHILGAIVPDFVGASKQPQAEATLALSYGNSGHIVNDWPAQITLNDYESGSIQIQKQGNAPVFVSLYQSRWEREPEPVDSLFAIQTHLQQNKEKTEVLTAGQSAQMVINMEVKKQASYLSLEVPILAGCSYGDKTGRNYREVHREYRKEKVNIYFRSLAPGRYSFTINLEPRYSGRYTLNPAKAEMMYEPISYGRNGVEAVLIGE